MRKKPTMRDVARAAGVSVMSVSYALRRHPSIPEATRLRIERAAGELGYGPNPLVTAFMREVRHRKESKVPPSIAYINGSREGISRQPLSSYQKNYYDGARERCAELGFGFGLVEAVRTGLSGRRLTDVLLYNNYCGLIFDQVPKDAAFSLDWESFPCVTWGASLKEPHLHRVQVNHYAAMELALQRLSALGYRRIGLATFESSSARIGHRYLAAYEIYQRQLSPRARIPALLPASPSEMTPGRFRSWMERHRPDALVDAGQRRYQQLLAQTGYRVPHDVAYAVSNRIDTPADSAELAGLNQHPFEVGRVAVDILIKQIYGQEKGIPKHRLVTFLDASWQDGPSAPAKN
ncbi:MAG TPA: LacI family DNA-binding transcriptional regulator [Chthoniobacteraceae bacterium]|nr:LacI family DNA-binding transcriptional regulator [Chthoniobacteraceae bacterium]